MSLGSCSTRPRPMTSRYSSIAITRLPSPSESWTSVIPLRKLRMPSWGIEAPGGARPIPGADDRRADRVVAPEHDRERPRVQDPSHRLGDVVPRALGIGGQHVDVAEGSPGPALELEVEVQSVVATVVIPAGPETQRMFPDAAGPEARTR